MNWNNEGWDISNKPPHRDDTCIVKCYCWPSIMSINNCFSLDMNYLTDMDKTYIVAIFKIKLK